MSKTEPVDRRTKDRFIRSRHAVGFISHKLHGFSRILFFVSHRSHESHRGCIARSARSLSATPSVHDWWAFSENHVLMFLCLKQNLSTEEQKTGLFAVVTRWVLSHTNCTDFHGFFFLSHTDHTNLTEAASQGMLAACRLRRVYTTGRLSVRIMYLCSNV